jgi:predicted acetyltransferase
VLPAHRRLGYATEMLRQSVDLTRAEGVERILITCDDDNVASAGVIERGGGVYESTVEGRAGVLKRRYWIS